MKQEDKDLKIKWYNEIKNQTFKDRLWNITADTLEEQFKINFRNMIFVISFNGFKDDPLPAIFGTINEFLEEGFCFETVNKKWKFYFLDFQESELREIKKLLSEGLEDSVLKNKAGLYAQFLKENTFRFREIDFLVELTAREKVYPSLQELAKTKIKKAFLDMLELDKNQILLFRSLDRINLLMLLNPGNSVRKKQYIHNLQNIFDFEFYKNPSLFREFPREKETYLKILKTWLMDQIELRKRKLDWSFLPEEYQYVQDYAENLLPQAEIKPRAAKVVPLATKANDPLTPYPRHIFADEKAFELFSLLTRHFKTPAAISFIFRKMAEKEKPPLILVNDTPFRKWFNEQGYDIQLENHTKTYDNAKNEDRLAAYGMAKELIMSN